MELTQTELEERSLLEELGPFEVFFEEHREPLFRALWVMTRDRQDAEEVAQEAFIRLLERWEEGHAIADPAAYLYRVAMNLWRSRVRRAGVAAKHLVHLREGPDATAAVDSTDAVVRTIAHLPPMQRAAVGLVDVLDMTSEQAGAALGIRPSTVRVHLARARDTLRKAADAKGPTP